MPRRFGLLIGVSLLCGCELFLGASPSDLLEAGHCADQTDNDGDLSIDCDDADCMDACFPCGNGILEPGEDCDDGNLIDLDGCEGDCAFLCGSGSGGSLATLDVSTDHCYLGFNETFNWQQAKVACEDLGGYLAVIDSASENALARTTSPLPTVPWIGFTDIQVEAGTDPFLFVKVTGGNLTFHNFDPNELNNDGNEDCVQFWQSGSGWNDTECLELTNFICELEPSPCGDGVVQRVLGEECDDGNNLNGDGCESDCSLICGGGTGAERAKLDSTIGHCYLGFNEILTWQEAEIACEEIGGYLTVIESANENTLVRSVSLAPNPWLGINDIQVEAGTDPFLFVKVTGGNLTFHNFKAGEPNDFGSNEDCVEFISGELWNDRSCSSTREYICELEGFPTD